MTLSCLYTQDDYLKAFRAHYREGAAWFTRWMFKTSLVIGSVLIFLGFCVIIQSPGRFDAILPPILLGIVWLWLGSGATARRIATTHFRKNPSLRQEHKIEAAEQGISFDYVVGRSESRWNMFLRFLETKE